MNAKELSTELNRIEKTQIPLTDKESQVQEAYNGYFKSRFKTDVLRVCKCDGYFSAKGSPLCLLMEYKFDKALENVLERAKVIAQAISYYKAIIETASIERKPNMIFVGDVNECFALHSNFIKKYIAFDIDWSVAACKMGDCVELVNAIASDNVLNENTFVSYPQKEDFENICLQMEAQARDNKRLIAITKGTIRLAFEYFCTKVLGKTSGIDSNTKVGVFMDAIKHFNERNIENGKLYTKNYAPVKISNQSSAIAYFSHFGENDEKELKRLENYFDFLVEDDKRRRDGFFITPKIFVDKANEMIGDYMEKVGIEDWHKDCIVWDNCCGTKSLTRDYEFGDLYLSTLQGNELKASDGVNAEARETFVFDFLNDSFTKLPERLIKDLRNAQKGGKKIVFLMNPPYAQATSGQGNEHKTGVKKTDAALKMNAEFGKASNELFVQFLYKVDELCTEYKMAKGQVIIATFSNPTWLSGNSYSEWRKYWLSKYSFKSGMMFNASEFANCSDTWGISFSIWENTKSANTNEFLHAIYDNDGGELSELGMHTLYNLDETVTGNKWCKGNNAPNQEKSISTTNGLNMLAKKSPSNRGSIAANSLGYFTTAGGDVYNSAMKCYLSSAAGSNANGFSITPENFDRVCALFTARKCIKNTWITTKDIYSAPDETNPAYTEFVKDAYIYAMFSPASNQTSVSGSVDGEEYEFFNYFYPFSKVETYSMLGKEIKTNTKDDSRYIRSSGKVNTATPDGRKVLSLFKACITASAPFREAYGKSHPELQLDRWDCGWRQLKDLFKTACPDKFNELRKAYAELESKLIPHVYELGFLKR